MQKIDTLAKQNKNQAAGKCPACGRHGLPVFLLRQAVITKNNHSNSDVDPIYQTLADYASQLDFKHRMPQETLTQYHYLLRTLRNGYVYVMQQGKELDSRMLDAYECIDGALRLKDAFSLSGTEPRPLSKACQDSCHSIPASFIHLDEKRFTQAWVAYSSQPWSTQTINNYLKQQDPLALSRFTHITSLNQFKTSPAQACGQRAVPFKDIFGYSYDAPINQQSNVLEFRFDRLLPNFESVHPFHSLKAQRARYAYQVNSLYTSRENASSCAIVLEDTLGIAEELNAQRLNHLHIFNYDAPPAKADDEPIADEPNLDFDINKQNSIYAQRAKNMLNMINPELKKRFRYYQNDLFKKRMIWQLIEQYRTSLERTYDQKIATLEQQDYIELANRDPYAYIGPFMAPPPKNAVTIIHLKQEKKKKLNQINACIDDDKVTQFNHELATAYNEVVDYCKRWSQDYFTYVRWLFGQKDVVSKFSPFSPKSFNQVHFWQSEFDFSNEISALSYIKVITQILLDSTHSEIRLDEDNALWDELLSNSTSIYYVISHKNNHGIDLNQPVFTDLINGNPINWLDITSKSTYFGAVYNAHHNKKYEKWQDQQQQQLTEYTQRLNAEIENSQQQLIKLQQKAKQIPIDDLAEQKQLRIQKTENKKAIEQAKKYLQSINDQLAALAIPKVLNETKIDHALSYLNDMAIKKHTQLVQHPQVQPINLRWNQLDMMQRLAKMAVYPVEITVKIRPDKLTQVYALLAQMQGGFFRQHGFNLQEQTFLRQFDVIDTPPSANHKAARFKQTKMMLCFPDELSKSLFIQFITKNREHILNPHKLKAFIQEKLYRYVTLIDQQTTINAQINKINRQQQTTVETLQQADQHNQQRKIVNQHIDEHQTSLTQQQAQLNTAKNKSAQIKQLKDTRKSAKATQLNYKVNAIVGVITLLNIWDTLKEWGKPKEGDIEAKQIRKLATDLASLGLLCVDTVAQYKEIKLKMQLTRGMRVGADVAELQSSIRLTSFISKTVAKAFATITVMDALTELKSSFGMLEMEDKDYFRMRFFGSFAVGLGAVLLLSKNPITLAVGVILLIFGTVLITFSKKYDNLSPIEHWLNRCYFGKHAEFTYLKYNAYHEQDYYAHAGFGQAVNDYLIAILGIDTFIYFKTVNAYFAEPDNQRHIQLYLNIPNFVLKTPQDKLNIYLRLYDEDTSSKEQKYIDFYYTATYHHIARQPTFQVINYIPEKPAIYGTDYILPEEQYQRHPYQLPNLIPQHQFYSADNLQGKKVKNIKGLIISQHDMDHQQQHQLNKSSDGKSYQLIIDKKIASTWDLSRIKNYQIIIHYPNHDQGPLIITKNGYNINDK